MTKSMKKDFGREIKNSLSRFVSILLIVSLGVAFYAGIRSSMPAMRNTADAVYDAENLMDIRIVSTLGLTEKDLAVIQNISGVEEAEGSYSTDFICLANSNEVVTKIISLSQSINDVNIIEGRFPEKYNECIVSKEFLDATGYVLEDYMTLATGTDDKVTDTLAAETFQIVGVCSSSYFLNGNMGTSGIGDGIVDGYAIIPQEAFVTDCYTTIYVTVKDAMELDCYGDEYSEKINAVIDSIKKIADKRCDIRFSEVRAKSSEMLEDARNDYEEAKVKVDTELAAAYQEILDNQLIIAESKTKLEEQKKILENAATEIPIRKQQIKDAEAKIVSGEAELAAAEKQIADGEAEIQRMSEKLKEQETEVQKAEEQLKALEEDPNTSPETLNDAKNALLLVKGIRNTLEKQINSQKTQIEKGKKEIEKNKAELEKAKIEVENGKKTIADVEKVLANSSAITDAEQKLKDAEIELQRGTEQYEISKQDAIDELADAEAELSKAENDINNMSVPVWYVLDRNSVESYMSFANDAESIGAIGTVFPIIFFVVAALVSLTTMTRMVEEQRTQIGTFKALGYSKSSIIGKYIMYALSATLIGSVLGVFVGEFTLPAIIVNAYKMVYYNLGTPIVNFNLVHGLTAVFAATVCTSAAAVAACYKELRSVPAELMRPESPKTGKRIFLENIDAIWERFNFGQKAAMRNLFRYKKRFFMTLFGVGGCMALLLVGFGIRDSVSAMATNQFEKVFTYDGVVSVDSTLTRAQRRALLADVDDISDIDSVLQANRTMIYSTNMEDTEFENEKNAYLVIPRNTDDFKQYVSLNEHGVVNSELNLIDAGVIITEKYADLLGLKVGDGMLIRFSESDSSPKEVKITGITENYIFNYVYMTPALYNTIYNEAPDLNALYFKTQTAVDTENLSEQLLNINGVNSVTMNSDELEKLDSYVSRLYFVVIILIVAAGLLAFVVLYNLNNINITERRRELATLKLLGFYDKETAMYVFRENIILTVLGTVLGIFLGIVLHKFVMRTVETDMYMFGKEITLLSIVLSTVLTVAFSVTVNFVMYFKLKKIDMVESLKSVE